MKYLLLTMLLFAACSTDYVEEAKLMSYNFPATDIWAKSCMTPGKVSDLEFDQTRQLPSRKAGLIIFNNQVGYHAAVVDEVIWNEEGYPVAYWMEGVTTLSIQSHGQDTVLTLAPCRFYAGIDSYPSIVGYKTWHNNRPYVVHPKEYFTMNGSKLPIFMEGDTLCVRADYNIPNGLKVSRWWIGNDGNL
jgi:hypothetical protein